MKFSIEEAKWRGSKYYAVKPSDLIVDHNWYSMESWLDETFGRRGNVWSGRGERYYINNARFLFQNESDAILFMLRWS